MRNEGTLFAEIKDILQKAQEDIVLEQALTVQQFEDLLFERYPQINNKKFGAFAVMNLYKNQISFNLMILLH